MTDQESFDEVVLLFEQDLSAIDSELHYREFEALVKRERPLPQFAASHVKAVYAVVGDKLSVRALVFFHLRIDEEGFVDHRFNLPLRYLAQQAGLGPNPSGDGRVRMAYRGHCPVPWHSASLWEPEGVGDLHPAMRIQKAIWRNKLKLTPRKTVAAANLNSSDLTNIQAQLEARLAQTLTRSGAIDVKGLLSQHADQLQQLSHRFEVELAHQQQAQAEKLHKAQLEIQALRAALKREKGRNRRLQEMLRDEREN